MKKIFLSAVAMVLGTIAMTAQNSVGISDFSITVGETKTISIELNNDESFAAFQMDLMLPEGITIANVDGIKCIALDENRKDESHSFAYNDIAGGVRLVAYSLDNATFSGTSGAVVNVVVTADDATEPSKSISLRNVIFSRPDATEVKFADATAAVAVSPYFTASVNYGAGGYAMLSKTQLSYGESMTLYILPKDGYTLASLLLNGEQVAVKDNIYNVDSAEQNMTFEASFKESVADTVVVVDTLEVIKTVVDTVEVIKTVTDTIEIETIEVDTIFIAEVTTVPAPEVTFADGQLSIECALQGATIYYTLDGTVPTTASEKYTSPVEVKEDCTVMAIAVVGSETTSFNIVGTGLGAVSDEVVSRKYYTEAGVEIDEPANGINIVVIKYASGKTETKKVVVRKK